MPLPKSRNLVPVVPIGTRNYSRWRLNDGTIIETPISDKEYAGLAAPGAKSPDRAAAGVPDDADWLFSAGGAPLYDSNDGRLPYGCYHVDHEGKKVLLGVGTLDPAVVRDTSDLTKTGSQIEADLLAASTDVTVDGITYVLQDGAIWQ